MSLEVHIERISIRLTTDRAAEDRGAERRSASHVPIRATAIEQSSRAIALGPATAICAEVTS